jgi:PPP family 3-phenylpropionic acid transporter
MDGVDGQARNLWLLRAACFFQIFSFGIQWSFSSVWMKDAGVGETLIGLISSTSIALWFFSGLLWGRLADRTGRPDRIVIAGSVLIGCSLFYLAYCQTSSQFFVYAVLIGICLPMVSTLMPLLAVSALGAGGRGKGYASYRIFGSFGYVLGNLVMPRVLDDIHALFIIAGCSFFIALVPLFFVRVERVQNRGQCSLRRALANRELLGFLVAVFFFALAIPAIFTFTWVYARDLGGDATFIGLLAAVQGGVALVALPLTGRGVDRFGARWLLLLAFIAQPLRAFSLSLVGSFEWLLLPQGFHFFTWAGFEVAGVLFVARLATEGNKGTAQALYMSAQVLGNLLGSALAGYLAEHYGYGIMYQTSAALAAIGLGVFAWQQWGAKDQVLGERAV